MDPFSLIPYFGSLGGPAAYGTLFVLVLGLSAVLFLPVPVFAIVVAAASVLDPFWVGVVAGIASAIGELSGYFIGAGSEKVLKKKGKEGLFYKRSGELFKRYGFWGIAAAAIFPITPIDFVGIIAGTLRYGWKKFVIAAAVGKIPRYMIVAYAGRVAINESWAAASENPVWALAVILTIVALIDFYYFWFKRHSASRPAPDGRKQKLTASRQKGKPISRPMSF